MPVPAASTATARGGRRPGCRGPATPEPRPPPPGHRAPRPAASRDDTPPRLTPTATTGRSGTGSPPRPRRRPTAPSSPWCCDRRSARALAGRAPRRAPTTTAPSRTGGSRDCATSWRSRGRRPLKRGRRQAPARGPQPAACRPRTAVAAPWPVAGSGRQRVATCPPRGAGRRGRRGRHDVWVVSPPAPTGRRHAGHRPRRRSRSSCPDRIAAGCPGERRAVRPRAPRVRR